MASTGFACNLREGIYSNIQNFAFSNIDKYSTAGLITRMTTDVTNVQNAYQMILRIAVRAPLMMICSMVMCFVINPTLSLIFLGALIFLGFVLFFIIYKVTPVFTSGFEKYDELNASVPENISRISNGYMLDEENMMLYSPDNSVVSVPFIAGAKSISMKDGFLCALSVRRICKYRADTEV